MLAPMKNDGFLLEQVLPLSLTVVVFVALVGLLYGEIHLLNSTVVSREHIDLSVRWSDVLIGLTIYLKTSIDFAIFIGRLMSRFPGWKNRVLIEIGTALGNALGTMIILVVWDVFREVRALMAFMIFIAALVLFRMAEEGLDHVKEHNQQHPLSWIRAVIFFEHVLSRFNRLVAPALNKLIPKLEINESVKHSVKALFLLSFSVPFILGLDDFAGYIPLFNIINVFGFAIGVFLGHTILNIFLFISPRRTITLVKNPVIAFIGSIAFVALGAWGLFEAARLVGFVAH